METTDPIVPPKAAELFALRLDIHGPVLRQDIGACHVWTGATDKDGYGLIYVRSGIALRIHRVAFALAYGHWPEPCGLHHCDNRRCGRSDHIFEGTRGDNIRDCVAKGRNFLPDGRGENNPRAKLTDDVVRYIRASAGRGVDLARELGVTKTVISQVRLHRTWRHVE